MRFFMDADSWYRHLQKSVIFNPRCLDDVQKEWLRGVAANDYKRGWLSKSAYADIAANVGLSA